MTRLPPGVAGSRPPRSGPGRRPAFEGGPPSYRVSCRVGPSPWAGRRGRGQPPCGPTARETPPVLLTTVLPLPRSLSRNGRRSGVDQELFQDSRGRRRGEAGGVGGREVRDAVAVLARRDRRGERDEPGPAGERRGRERPGGDGVALEGDGVAAEGARAGDQIRAVQTVPQIAVRVPGQPQRKRRGDQRVDPGAVQQDGRNAAPRPASTAVPGRTTNSRPRTRRRRSATRGCGVSAAGAALPGKGERRVPPATRSASARGAGGSSPLRLRFSSRLPRPPATARTSAPPPARSSSGSRSTTPRSRARSMVTARVVSSPRRTRSVRESVHSRQ